MAARGLLACAAIAYATACHFGAVHTAPATSPPPSASPAPRPPVATAAAGPVTIAEQMGEINALALDEDNVYVASASGLAVVRKSGETPPRWLVGGYVNALVVNGEVVYFSQGTRIYGVRSDGTGSRVLLASDLEDPADVAAGPDAVYWLNEGRDQGRAGPSTTGGLFRVPKAGGEPTRLAGPLHRAGGLAVDETNAYFISDRRLSSIPRAGGRPRLRARSAITGLLAMVRSVATEGNPATAWTDLFFVEDLYTRVSGGVVFSGSRVHETCGTCDVDPADLPPGNTAETRAEILALAATREEVFWIEGAVRDTAPVPGRPEDCLQLVAMPARGGTPRVLLANRPLGRALAVDGTGIYVAEGEGCRRHAPGILRLPR